MTGIVTEAGSIACSSSPGTSAVSVVSPSPTIVSTLPDTETTLLSLSALVYVRSAVRSGASYLLPVESTNCTTAVNVIGWSPIFRRVRLSDQTMDWIFFTVTVNVLVTGVAALYSSVSSVEAVIVAVPSATVINELPLIFNTSSSLEE